MEDLNLGCPQTKAKEGHYGGYLILSKTDWPLLEKIVGLLARELSIPVHVKLRLCSSRDLTPVLALQLAKQGASVVTLHARHVSARRRRKGPADLDAVKQLVQFLNRDDVCTRVITNGNVRNFQDVIRNIDSTGASGAMVGEALLINPR